MEKTLYLASVALAWALAPALAHAQSANTLGRQGNQYYKEDRFDEAADAYRRALELDPASPLLQYNLGTALASKGNASDAEKALKQAAETPGAPVARDSWFNLGVALGDTAATPPAASPKPADPAPIQQSVDQLKKALDAFRHAVLLDPQDDAAKYNYEVTQERLKKLQEELKKAEQQQQQQQQQQQKQDQKDQNQKQQQDEQKQDQDKQQDQQQQDQQQDQDRKNGEQQDKQNGSAQGTPAPTPTPQSANPNQAQSAEASAQEESDKQLTPEQMNAMRLLNLLEQENPEQFKRLFQFRGGQRKLDKEW